MEPHARGSRNAAPAALPKLPSDPLLAAYASGAAEEAAAAAAAAVAATETPSVRHDESAERLATVKAVGGFGGGLLGGGGSTVDVNTMGAAAPRTGTRITDSGVVSDTGVKGTCACCGV